MAPEAGWGNYSSPPGSPRREREPSAGVIVPSQGESREHGGRGVYIYPFGLGDTRPRNWASPVAVWSCQGGPETSCGVRSDAHGCLTFCAGESFRCRKLCGQGCPRSQARQGVQTTPRGPGRATSGIMETVGKLVLLSSLRSLRLRSESWFPARTLLIPAPVR